MMKRLPLLLALLVAPLALFAASAPATPELPPWIKAPTDQAAFRRFVLDNGIRVLLVSDSKFNKSGAALAVHAGSLAETSQREGLAHFLEHMLFLGTEKYPDVSEYSAFMKANGGYDNAYTANDHTNYQFEVRHEVLPEALDRFAQFFISPKFSPEYTGREITAVHNEAMRHVQNDGWRQLLVKSEVYAKGSGESRFNIGNKDTLTGTSPAEVRAFYEKHYTSDHMTLAIAGKASLDELEKLARTIFATLPRRPVPPVVHEQKFLPRKAALRTVFMQPAKEVRQLTLEFPIPAMYADFVSKPDALIADLIGYGGVGGIEQLLKHEGLANNIGAGTNDRTNAYASFIISADLTPAGYRDYQKVLGLVFSYLAHLRAAPFPASFYEERVRIAQLNETYGDRGEGAGLATQLSRQLLQFPLAVAERAPAVLGRADEAAYRRLLDVLSPDNLLVAVMAKGVPTDKADRIFQTPYSYREETGPAYDTLLKPGKVAGFALPPANQFMPTTTALVAERPLPLIDEPGLRLYYAADTEFLRPQTTLIFRFVPVRAIASADSAALLEIYRASLQEFLDAVSTDTAFAGIETSIEAGLEGFRIAITGYGDSPIRYASYLADNLLTFTITPERFEARREAVLRGLKSYEQSEAYQLAGGRRTAFVREFQYLPPELLARSAAATGPEVRAFAAKFFARGQIEALVHGHLPADDAIVAARGLARRIGAAAAPENELVRRRHLTLKAGENIVDAGEITGGNSAFVRDYLLPPDSPMLQAASVVIANFIADLFYTELRTKQQLGYIVGSSASASIRMRSLSFIIQSSGYAPDELERRAEDFIKTLPASLATITDEQWATLKAGARSNLEEKPKSIADKAGLFFARAYVYDGDWERQANALRALDTLTKAEAVDLLSSTLKTETARRRTVLLWPKNHVPKAPLQPTFTDRPAWKATRKFE